MFKIKGFSNDENAKDDKGKLKLSLSLPLRSYAILPLSGNTALRSTMTLRIGAKSKCSDTLMRFSVIGLRSLRITIQSTRKAAYPTTNIAPVTWRSSVK